MDISKHHNPEKMSTTIPSDPADQQQNGRKNVVDWNVPVLWKIRLASYQIGAISCCSCKR